MTAKPTVLSDVEAHRLLVAVINSARSEMSLLHKQLSRETEFDLVIPSRNLFRHYVKLAAQLAEWRELRAWFLGPNCAAYCALLELDVSKVRDSVAPYSNLPYNARVFADLLGKAISAAEERFGPATEVGTNGGA